MAIAAECSITSFPNRKTDPLKKAKREKERGKHRTAGV